jgi:phospholipase C
LPRRYVVEPREQLEDDWAAMADDGGRYDLWVLGPNGFHRAFKGDLNTLRARNAADPDIRVGYQSRGGELHLKLRNVGERSCVFTVKPGAYRKDGPWTVRVKGNDDVALHWDTDDSGFWYDFIVTCDADPSFYRRIAGRIETGRHSVSDPAMGLGT